MAIFLQTLAFAQSPEESSILDLKPVCNKEADIVKWLSRIQPDDEEVVIFYFAPNICPRCEGSVWTLAKLLHKHNTKSVLVVDIDNAEAGKAYLKNTPGIDFASFGYILYDVRGLFKSTVNVSATLPPSYPLVYKINRKTGKFLLLDFLGGKDIGEAFAQKIMDAHTPIEGCGQVALAKKEKTVPQRNGWGSRKPLAVPKDMTQPMFFGGNNNKLYFVEMTTGNIALFGTDGSNVKIIKSTPKELYHNIDTSDTALMAKIQRDFLNTGYLKAIYLSCKYMKDGQLAITASLPKIWYEDTNGYYMNKATLLKKDTLNNLLGTHNMIPAVDTEFSVMHTYYEPMDSAFIYGLPMVKGWPAVGYDLDTADKNNNPFAAQFYRHTPIIALKNGDSTFYLGALPSIAQELKTGYYYYYTMYTYSEDKFFLLERMSGELQVFDKDDALKGVNKFEVTQLLQDKQDSLRRILHVSNPEPTMDYLNVYQKVMTEYLVSDIRFYKKNLYALIKKGQKLIVRKYDDKGATLIASKELPINNLDLLKAEVLQYDEKNDSVAVYAIEKQDGNFYLCKIDVKF
ncbi:MAG: hypothetical protein QM642_07400 [Edaphocola sp.]